MRFTVLGSGAACPPAGSNSSGYLVEENGHTTVLDCGHGVASSVLRVRPQFDIDDIVITHMHADHFIDIVPLRFRVTRDMGGVAKRKVRLHLPPGGIESIHALMRVLSFPEEFCENTFDVSEFDPNGELELGPLKVRFAPAVHYVPSWSVRIEGSGTITYTGDTAPSDDVTELARGCDLLVAEGTLNEPEPGLVKGHMTPEQAAEMACDAGSKELLLTHFWYGTDLADFERRGASVYPGPLLMASDGMARDIQSP